MFKPFILILSRMPEVNMDLTSIGILVIFIGFIIVFIGTLMQSQKSDAKVAVGGFIGFIPFGFVNDKRMLWVLLAVMSILIFFFILPYFLRVK